MNIQSDWPRPPAPAPAMQTLALHCRASARVPASGYMVVVGLYTMRGVVVKPRALYVTRKGLREQFPFILPGRDCSIFRSDERGTQFACGHDAP